MDRNAPIAAGCLAIVLMLSGCGKSPVELAPIAGKWVHRSNQSQDWTYEFPNDDVVRFAIDGQRQKWSITEIRARGSIIEIDVDGLLGRGPKQNSTIKVEILREDAIFISSGLHPGLPFEKTK